MIEFAVGLGLLILVLATRSRLERAERELREQADTLRLQSERLARAERRLEVLNVQPMAAPQLSAAPAEPAPAQVQPVETAHAPELPVTADPPAVPLAAAVPADAPALPDSFDAAAAVGPAAPDVPASPPPSAAGAHPAGPAHPPLPAAGPDPIARALEALRELLFGGNTVVRAGILVLLVGIVLLLRWAAEHALFPIELRLAGVAILALALTGFGYAQRRAKPGFALTLQGGGVAALYLVVFFAFRSYGLLPAPLAFALLCVIALSAGVLSVRQDSKSLIVIAQLFGFAAPLLASTGKGSHVALFSYYLLLNLLVFAVAFWKAWRALNLLGFVFTFGVATAWGALRYEPQLFASTEPFLIAFFAVYVAIPVLFALRYPDDRGWVDGSLVFGTPLSALGLQWALVHGRPFGMAFSVLALAAVYLGLALFIKRRAPQRLAAMGEAFLPIGVGFATLAIPYGFDDHNLTGAAWALEGAGLYWIGVRQTRWLSRLAGTALQLAAGIAATIHPLRQSGALPVLNTWFLASALIGSSALFVAQHAHVQRGRVPELERRALQLLIPWGLLFWLRGALGEVDAWVPSHYQTGLELAVLAAQALALESIGRRTDWLWGRVPALLLWPIMAVYLADYAWSLHAQPFSHGGVIGWPLLLLAMVTTLRKLVDAQPRLIGAHASALWLWSLFAALLLEQLCDHELALDESFGAAAGDLALALIGWAVLAQSRRGSWPFGVQRAHYLQIGMLGLCAIGSLRAGMYNLNLASDTAPLPYLPVLNPLDLSSLIGAFVALRWLRRLRAEAPPLCTAAQARWGLALIAALLFAWWNAQLARSVHHYAQVPLAWGDMLDSSAFQLACSLSWTTIALGVMWVGHRRGLRAPWIAAAVLLAIVVAKLFLLDLQQLSTPTKIVSFLGVGGLLLLIGYVAPVPPRLASVLLLLMAAGQARAQGPDVAELGPSDFAFGRTVELLDGAQPLAAVSIPVDVYRDSRSDGLYDVCVFNGQGQQVPHALQREAAAGAVPADDPGTPVPFFPVTVQHAQAPLELSVSISRGEDGHVLSLKSDDKPAAPGPLQVAAYLLDVRAVPQASRGLHAARFEWIDAPDNLILPLSIDASEDLITWRPLQVEGGLLHLSHAGQRIERDRVQWTPSETDFLRVRPQSQPSFPAQLRAARVEAVPETPAPERERVAVKAGQGSDPAKGVYRFDLGGDIPVEELEVELPEDNSVIAGELWSASAAEGPYQRLTEGRFYRVLSQGQPLTGPRLRVFRQRARFYELRVDRSRVGLGSGTPTLATYHTPEQLLFLLRGAAPFTVAYGRHLVRRQRFEPEELLALLPAQPGGTAATPARARLGEKRNLGGPALLKAPVPQPPYRMYALWAVLIAGVGMLGVLAYRLARSES